MGKRNKFIFIILIFFTQSRKESKEIFATYFCFASLREKKLFLVDKTSSMKYPATLLLICSFCVVTCSIAQPGIKVLESGKRISIRGLSVVDNNVIWASGSAGSVARSVDGGNSFTWMTVPGYEKRDFRDIEAFDQHTAIIIGVAEPGIILKTKDGGKSWKKVFEDTTKGMFLDAMDFKDEKYGVVLGDPIEQTIYMAFTNDQGESWEKPNLAPGFLNQQSARKGEAFFASSGTNLKFIGNHPIFVSGGTHSRLFYRPQDGLPIPIVQGKESTGANSIAVYKDDRGVIVGGDFTKDTVSSDNMVLFKIREKMKFSKPAIPPHGYRSCIIYLSKRDLLTCGTSGVDISKDGGKNWQLISKESFHVCQKAKKGKAVFLAGGNGRIAKLVYP